MRREPIYIVAAILSLLLPCLPLLNTDCKFPADWPNQIWLLNYSGAFFKAHGSFTPVINTFEMTGMPYPIFYGYLLFPTLAVLSTRFDGGLAVRLAAVAVYAAQYLLLYLFVKKESNNRFLSFAVASIVIWSVYPMTNLYNRGAIPEFVGTALLFCAAVLALFAVRARSFKFRFLTTNLSFLTWTFAAGAHPITALFGCLALAIIAGLALFVSDRRPLKELLICSLVPALFSFVCLFPWAYATVHCRPTISQTFTNTLYFPTTLDSLYWRFAPLPIPTKSHIHKLQDARIGVKHIDCQVSTPLLILFVTALFILCRRGRLDRRLLFSTGALALLTAVISWSSVTPHSWDQLGELARSIQFPYRLVTYINLFFLTGLLLAIAFHDRESPLRLPNRALSVALSIALLSVTIKLAHALVVATPDPHACQLRTVVDNAWLTHLPKTFYGYPAYYSVGTYEKLQSKDVDTKDCVNFQPLYEKHFGEADTFMVTDREGDRASERKPLATSVEACTWNRVAATTNRDKAQLFEFINKDDNKIAVKLSGAGTLKYEFAPDRLWSTFNAAALPLSQFWLYASLLTSLLWLRAERWESCTAPGTGKSERFQPGGREPLPDPDSSDRARIKS